MFTTPPDLYFGAALNVRQDARWQGGWCRLSGTGTIYIEPGSPWENPFVESFNGRVRDELLNIEEFATLLEAQVVIEAWRAEYNTYRPHASLGWVTSPR